MRVSNANSSFVADITDDSCIEIKIIYSENVENTYTLNYFLNFYVQSYTIDAVKLPCYANTFLDINLMNKHLLCCDTIIDDDVEEFKDAINEESNNENRDKSNEVGSDDKNEDNNYDSKYDINDNINENINVVSNHDINTSNDDDSNKNINSDSNDDINDDCYYNINDCSYKNSYDNTDSNYCSKDNINKDSNYKINDNSNDDTNNDSNDASTEDSVGCSSNVSINDSGDDKNNDNNEHSFNSDNNLSFSDTESKCPSLSCVAINVGGLTSKLLHPDFDYFVKSHDIVCISESKLSNTDIVNIQGYTSFYKNRKKYRRKSGGILLLVKDCYVKHLKIFENEVYKSTIDSNIINKYTFTNYELCEKALFFTIDDIITNKSVLFAAVYIEPHNSDYFDRNAFQKLEESLLQFNHEHICLLGDFNSR